jgi:hypothetical protein
MEVIMKLLKKFLALLCIFSNLGSVVSLSAAGALPLRGLRNEGNTCFMNSTMQALFHCPALRDHIISGLNHLAEASALPAAQPLPPLLRELCNTFAALAVNAPAPYSPLALANEVWGLRSLLGDIKFPHATQADAEELFNSIADAFGAARKPMKIGDGMRAVTITRCNSCGQQNAPMFEREASIPKMGLCFPEVATGGVPIDPKQGYSLDALLTTIVGAQTTISGSNGLECERCQIEAVERGDRSHVTHQYKGADAYRFPASVHSSLQLSFDEHFLVLQIKRFKRDRFGVVSAKIKNPVICPGGQVLFSDHDGNVHDFVIDSLVMHGGSLSGGHYFELSRSGFCSDSTIRQGSGPFEEALRTGRYDGAEIYMLVCSRSGYVPAPVALSPALVLAAAAPFIGPAVLDDSEDSDSEDSSDEEDDALAAPVKRTCAVAPPVAGDLPLELDTVVRTAQAASLAHEGSSFLTPSWMKALGACAGVGAGLVAGAGLVELNALVTGLYPAAEVAIDALLATLAAGGAAIGATVASKLTAGGGQKPPEKSVTGSKKRGR